MPAVVIAGERGTYQNIGWYLQTDIFVRGAIPKGGTGMYKVEVKPGVGFSQCFPTICEARIFVRELNEAMTLLGLVPFRCEIIRISEGVKNYARNEQQKKKA